MLFNTPPADTKKTGRSTSVLVGDVKAWATYIHCEVTHIPLIKGYENGRYTVIRQEMNYIKHI